MFVKGLKHICKYGTWYHTNFCENNLAIGYSFKKIPGQHVQDVPAPVGVLGSETLTAQGMGFVALMAVSTHVGLHLHPSWLLPLSSKLFNQSGKITILHFHCFYLPSKPCNIYFSIYSISPPWLYCFSYITFLPFCFNSYFNLIIKFPIC